MVIDVIALAYSKESLVTMANHEGFLKFVYIRARNLADFYPIY